MTGSLRALNSEFAEIYPSPGSLTRSDLSHKGDVTFEAASLEDLEVLNS
jgi:hypothetical protein